MSEAIHSGTLFVVSAPSGAGKTSLVRALIESDSTVGVCISHTTRRQRDGEEDGINYHFIEDTAFRSMVDAGEFIEWAHVFEHLYGTSIHAANEVLDSGKHLILEIDWQGAAQISQRIPDTKTIFIFPPSLDSLRSRLESRAQDDDETVEKRMAAAFEELSHFEEFDYLIVNDEFDEALSELQDIVSGEGNQLTRAKRLPALNSLICDLLPQNTL
ncbi:MAG: guanylate kinase [Gammaproteobacteria bacterium]|jgi:guanylate kinase|nr:guanylate kinase [Gammaproteobacteria bacterium]MBT4494670.1 guanylate kinase [Gammaproteobacteria bacterium]MBT7370920.1 guanylate kinase [Gammaproteobacteria bacterium]